MMENAPMTASKNCPTSPMYCKQVLSGPGLQISRESWKYPSFYSQEYLEGQLFCDLLWHCREALTWQDTAKINCLGVKEQVLSYAALPWSCPGVASWGPLCCIPWSTEPGQQYRWGSEEQQASETASTYGLAVLNSRCPQNCSETPDKYDAEEIESCLVRIEGEEIEYPQSGCNCQNVMGSYPLQAILVAALHKAFMLQGKRDAE